MFKKREKLDIVNLIKLYRFVSIFLTAFIYIVRGILGHYTVSGMLILVSCVVASAFLMNYLYSISYDIRPRLHLLLFMEIAGISVIILLTGGLDSPFIWCFLNPLLIISYYLSIRQKIVYLATNISLLCAIGFFVDKTPNVREYLLGRSNIILSYILLLVLINILVNYSRQITIKQEELRSANEILENYNSRIKGMIQDIMFMYESVQIVPGQRDYSEIIHIILDFAGRVLPESNAFFVGDSPEYTNRLISLKAIPQNISDLILETVKSDNPGISKNHVGTGVLDTNQTVVFIGISDIKVYGVIGLLIPKTDYDLGKSEYEANILLIAQLGATFFEKIEAEMVVYELAVADEQNRIADDIHDSVIQRLFATSCFTYDIIKKWNDISDDIKKENITLVMETIQSALKDLRSTIYNLSNKKQQISLFKESVNSFLSDMEKLSGIKISLDIKGEPDKFSLSAKKALYRIITECAGNAIRHSKCSSIWVSLQIGEAQTNLSIKDDGVGLDIEKAEQEKRGLGLYNIKSLVRIFNGSIAILSEKGSGTTFEMVFMNEDIVKRPDEE